jgi:putative hydrolase of the HAD superfamily
VSNWDSRLHAVLRGLGLAGRFRFVLTSAEYGAEKPDPSIFREAARRLDLPTEQVLHAGDLLEEDVGGATGAGMLAALVDRACGDAPLKPAVLRVCDLRELPDFLAD